MVVKSGACKRMTLTGSCKQLLLLLLLSTVTLLPVTAYADNVVTNMSCKGEGQFTISDMSSYKTLLNRIAGGQEWRHELRGTAIVDRVSVAVLQSTASVV